MKLQALTVSVNYSDFLVHAISANKNLFDKWVVVTDFDDWVTRRLCEENGVTCLLRGSYPPLGGKLLIYICLA